MRICSIYVFVACSPEQPFPLGLGGLVAAAEVVVAGGDFLRGQIPSHQSSLKSTCPRTEPRASVDLHRPGEDQHVAPSGAEPIPRGYHRAQPPGDNWQALLHLSEPGGLSIDVRGHGTQDRRPFTANVCRVDCRGD